MAGVTSISVVVISIFVVFLSTSVPIIQGDELVPTGSASPSPASSECRTVTQFCGGIIGFQCCEGLECILEGDFPDAGGECQPKQTCKTAEQMCGGIAGFQCCEGLECQLNGSFPDASGVCKPMCHQAKDFCGGFTGIQCCSGLKCVIEDDFPDAGGVCESVSTY